MSQSGQAKGGLGMSGIAFEIVQDNLRLKGPSFGAYEFSGSFLD